MTKNGEAHEPGSSLARSRIDRRGFFRGAALLGGLGATGLLPALEPRRALAAEPEQITGATAALAAQTRRILRWAGPAPADWVRPRAGVD